jgi:serine phosphatase RsbU (regulator of sigma subunit)
MKFIFSLFNILIVCGLLSQNSARTLLDKAKSFRQNNLDSHLIYIEKTIVAAQQEKNDTVYGRAIIEKGIYSYTSNKFDESNKYYLKGINIAMQTNDSMGIGSAYINLAMLENRLGVNANVIRYYQAAMRYTYSLLPKVRNYLIAANGLGRIYLDQLKLDSADYYYNKSLVKSKEFEIEKTYFVALQGLASVDYYKGRYKAAIFKNREAMKHYMDLGDSATLFLIANNTSSNFLKLNLYDSTKYFLDVASRYSKNQMFDEGFANLSVGYADYFAKIGRYDSAYLYMIEYSKLKDSLNNIDAQEQVIKMNSAFEAEKKDLLIKQQEGTIEIASVKNQQKNYFIYGGLLAFCIVSILGFFAFRNYSRVRKANGIIQEQNLQLGVSNQEISEKKDQLEEKNKEIMESMIYSKYLQTAILPKEEQFNKISKINFLKYQPKDIVSGDYYWTYNTPNGLCIWATMDCTGHGVPGAMMSMLGVSLLNEIVIEKHIYQPNEILNRLRERIISALNLNESSDLKDGMDGSVCVWDKMKNAFTYASANSSVWVFRDQNFVELKYDKMPIGKHIVMEPFQLYDFELMQDDWVISMSDGLADQFGGPENKKLKYKRVREFLTKKLSLTDHATILPDLKEFYEDWKGLNEQTDDVTVLGIKIS